VLTSDYGTITLLFQDDRGGLEVLSPKGGFVPATPIPDTIVVNAGDLLQRWSNDVIRSTEHRVVSPRTPPQDDHFPARYSIAYFCNPNWDATIECLDGCYGDAQGGKEKKYTPINTHEYLVSRLKATY
jgi:isopenicillin N synthase-like dioxygenase